MSRPCPGQRRRLWPLPGSPSMVATLATDFFELRAADEQKRLLDDTVEA